MEHEACLVRHREMESSFVARAGVQSYDYSSLQLLPSNQDQRWGFSMLAGLVSKPWSQVIHLPQPLKVLGLQIFTELTQPRQCAKHREYTQNKATAPAATELEARTCTERSGNGGTPALPSPGQGSAHFLRLSKCFAGLPFRLTVYSVLEPCRHLEEHRTQEMKCQPPISTLDHNI
ncbi:hypothetical protein AAY473_031299 [Plecturocebus cupreus]